jgi:hypothetical protein
MLVPLDEDAPARPFGDCCVRVAFRASKHHDWDRTVLDVVRREAELHLIAGHAGEAKCYITPLLELLVRFVPSHAGDNL